MCNGSMENRIEGFCEVIYLYKIESTSGKVDPIKASQPKE